MSTVNRKFMIVKKSNVYTSANKSSKVKRKVDPATNRYYTATKYSNGYYYFEALGGYVSSNNLKAYESRSLAQNESMVTKNMSYSDKLAYQTGKLKGAAFKAAITTMLSNEAKLNDTVLDESTRLFGMPHRFNRFTDMPFSETTQMGRKYAETFAMEAPILCIAAGRPNYMPGTTSIEKRGMMMGFGNIKEKKYDGSTNELLNQLGNNKDMRYFNFQSDFSSYIRYVNLLCRTAAIYMGIGDLEMLEKNGKRTRKYSKYNWSKYRYHTTQASATTGKKEPHAIGGSVFEKLKDKTIKKVQETYQAMTEALTGNYDYTQFYVDPATSFQETASNSTGESMVSSVLNEADSTLKEFSFLVNAGGMSWADRGVKNAMSSITTSVTKMGYNSTLQRLFSTGTTVLSGGTMIMPEIYKSSDYSKSYNVTINLTSPYGDRESVYLNIIVPLMHLICLALPKQNTANSYAAPFMVRATSKGLFNCEMGFVESLSIEKVQGSYTIFGMPTEVKVQMTIKDVYPNLMMTPDNAPIMFWENSGMRQWLAVLCGLDITKPHIVEKYQAIFELMINSVQDLPDRISNSILEYTRNKIDWIWKK